MPDSHESRSEVVRLLAQIHREYEAAQQGLSGLAQGISQHQFITRRMERVGELYSRLHNLLGHEAMELIEAQAAPLSEEKEIMDQEQNHKEV